MCDISVIPSLERPKSATFDLRQKYQRKLIHLSTSVIRKTEIKRFIYEQKLVTTHHCMHRLLGMLVVENYAYDVTRKERQKEIGGVST